MRNKTIAVVLSVIGVTAIGYGAYALAGDSKPSPKFTESSCMPSPCKQLLPPAWSSSTTVTTAPKQAELTVTTLPPTTAKAVARPTTSTTSSTTTSEVPPPLTPEQAAKIPPAWMTPSEIAWCDSTHQSYESCQFSESQGMGENTNGTDSDQ